MSQALAQDRDFDQVVSEFRRANALIRPTPITARVWVSLYQEIEKVRRQACTGAYWQVPYCLVHAVFVRQALAHPIHRMQNNMILMLCFFVLNIKYLNVYFSACD